MENHTATHPNHTNMLNAILQLNGYTYYYRSDEYPEYQLPETPQIGLMAQEVEQVFPQLVVTNQVGHKAVNYMGLIPVLVEAIKQQHALVQQQSAQIDRLEKMIASKS